MNMIKKFDEFVNESLVLESISDYKNIVIDTLALYRNNFELLDECKKIRVGDDNNLYVLYMKESSFDKGRFYPSYGKLKDFITDKGVYVAYTELPEVIEAVKKYVDVEKLNDADVRDTVGALYSCGLDGADTLYLTDSTDETWYKHKGYKGKCAVIVGK